MSGWLRNNKSETNDESRTDASDLSALWAAAKAVPLDFPIEWDAGAPMPHVLQNDGKTFLAFYVNVVDPAWDGSLSVAREPAKESAKLALVSFKRCIAAKLGAPNDEAMGGHPLFGKGLKFYTAQFVENSPWIAELQKINMSHPHYRPESWTAFKHYVFWFHDSTFECIAKSFAVETFSGTLSDLLADVCKRLVR